MEDGPDENVTRRGSGVVTFSEGPESGRSVPTPGITPRSPTALRYALGGALGAAVVVAVLAATGALGPHGPTTSSVQRVTLFHNTLPQAFGPGTTNATVVPFTIPLGVLNATVYGTFTVLANVYDDNALGYVMILTPTQWTSIIDGGLPTAIWCQEIGGSCQAATTINVAPGNLTAYAGTQLDLAFYSADTVRANAFLADITLAYLS